MFLFVQKNAGYVIYIFLIVNSKNVSAVELEKESFEQAVEVAAETYNAFLEMFRKCVGSPMSNQQFKIDNMKSFINSQGRTTVGSAPRLTSNRKFFANVVATREFKDMLDRDIDTIRGNYVKKMKYCDSTVMNQQLLKEFYNREVDQTKM